MVRNVHEPTLNDRTQETVDACAEATVSAHTEHLVQCKVDARTAGVEPKMNDKPR